MSGRDRAGVGALVVCLILAVVIAALTPDPNDDRPRRYVTAPVGRWAEEPDLSFTVRSVTITQAVQATSQEPFRSTERLLVLDVQAAVRHQLAELNDAVVQTRDDHRYAPRDEFTSQGLTGTQPGFTCNATLIFELPTGRVPGAQLIIDGSKGSAENTGTALRIDLGLDAASPVRRAPVVINDSTVVTTP